MSFQDFDAARRERLRALEPIRFRLGGKEFTCVAVPTLADSFDLAMAPEPKTFDGTPNAVAIYALTEFIERMLVSRKQRREFRKLLSRRKDVIDADSIIELAEYIVKEYTARPLDSSNDSSAGPPTDGSNSTTERFAPADPSPA